MKHQSFAWLSIESIANNGIVKSLRMSTMHTKLVSAACYGMKFEQSMALNVCQDFVMRFGCFTMLPVDYLSRTIIEIRAQRKADDALLFKRHLPFEQGMIDFVYEAMQEEVLQFVVLLFGQSYEHQATCIHIESMHNEWPFCRWNGGFYCISQIWEFVFTWDRKHPCRLTHHSQLPIIIYNV